MLSKRNKIFILLRSTVPHKNSCRSSAAEPFAGLAALPAAAAAADQSRVSGSVATKLRFCFVWLSDPVLLSLDLPRSTYHKPPWMSTHFSARSGSAALELGLKLLVCHGVNQRDALAAVVQRPPYPIDIPVLVQQVNGVDLPGRVRPHILRQPKCLGCALDILPDSLPGVVLPWTRFRLHTRCEFAGMALIMKNSKAKVELRLYISSFSGYNIFESNL